MVICHWGHLSPVSPDILFCNFVSTSVIFFQLPNRWFRGSPQHVPHITTRRHTADETARFEESVPIALEGDRRDTGHAGLELDDDVGGGAIRTTIGGAAARGGGVAGDDGDDKGGKGGEEEEGNDGDSVSVCC